MGEAKSKDPVEFTKDALMKPTGSFDSVPFAARSGTALRMTRGFGDYFWQMLYGISSCARL